MAVPLRLATSAPFPGRPVHVKLDAQIHLGQSRVSQKMKKNENTGKFINFPKYKEYASLV